MDWVRDFYSRTGAWWGPAEAAISERDRGRVRTLHDLCGGRPLRILELGCGYGNTVAAMVEAGHAVTGVEVSDRADFASRFGSQLRDGSRIVKDDFYTADLGGPFDVVCYYNGFGVGSDADQRRLLRRIAADWLAPGGTVLIDIANPFVWARWDGTQEHRPARPEAGYHYELAQVIRFDPVNSRFFDTWWQIDTPDERWTQNVRCYTPADLRLLLEGTGLKLASVRLADQSFSADNSDPGLSSLLEQAHEYLAVLQLG